MQTPIIERTMAMLVRQKCDDRSRTQSEEQDDGEQEEESRDHHHHIEKWYETNGGIAGPLVVVVKCSSFRNKLNNR